MAAQGLQAFLAEHGLHAAIWTPVAPPLLAAAAGNAVVAAASATTLRVVIVFLIIETSRGSVAGAGRRPSGKGLWCTERRRLPTAGLTPCH